ncbi:MAG: Glucose 1-dehydrogenase 4 [Chlamydiia bacterium]|nr:Glucose 1-dehydrogenase 4 [Chlamydiia bacterium]
MKDKVVIITGATKGMGFGEAKHFLELGSKVALVYRGDEEKALEVARELAMYKDQSLYIKADITKAVDRQKIVDETLKTFGKIDVLVNNAGVAAKSGFLKENEEDFNKIIDVNLTAPIFLAQLVSKQMIDQGDGGSIINFSSIAGHRGMGGISYDAAKAGIIIATETMANALGEYGIRVNSISPGYHKTEMNRYHWENKTDLHKYMEQAIPLKFISEASQIAGTVEFLASDKSAYITGTDILVDGGYTKIWPGRMFADK